MEFLSIIILSPVIFKLLSVITSTEPKASTSPFTPEIFIFSDLILNSSA